MNHKSARTYEQLISQKIKKLNKILSIKNNIVLLQVHKVVCDGFTYPFKTLYIRRKSTSVERPSSLCLLIESWTERLVKSLSLIHI